MMFWKERERESRKDRNGRADRCGFSLSAIQVLEKIHLFILLLKVLLLLLHLRRLGVKFFFFLVGGWVYSWSEAHGSSSNSIKGVIFVHGLSQRRTKTSLQNWSVEISTTGTFSVPLGSDGPGGLPVPYLIIGNKADIAAKESTRGSSGNLVDAARQWVEKQGLLPSSEELPLTESFPGTSGLLAAAKESRYDKEAVIKFFRMLIRRRYFSDELPSLSTWSVSPIQNSIHHSRESLSDDDQFHKTASSSVDLYNYNALPPLPAQRNLTPPPTLYPQQPVSISESYSVPRFSSNSLSDFGSTKSRRADLNI